MQICSFSSVVSDTLRPRLDVQGKLNLRRCYSQRGAKVVVNAATSQIRSQRFQPLDDYIESGRLNSEGVLQRVQQLFEDESVEKFKDGLQLFGIGETFVKGRLFPEDRRKNAIDYIIQYIGRTTFDSKDLAEVAMLLGYIRFQRPPAMMMEPIYAQACKSVDELSLEDLSKLLFRAENYRFARTFQENTSPLAREFVMQVDRASYNDLSRALKTLCKFPRLLDDPAKDIPRLFEAYDQKAASSRNLRNDVSMALASLDGPVLFPTVPPHIYPTVERIRDSMNELEANPNLSANVLSVFSLAQSFVDLKGAQEKAIEIYKGALDTTRFSIQNKLHAIKAILLLTHDDAALKGVWEAINVERVPPNTIASALEVCALAGSSVNQDFEQNVLRQGDKALDRRPSYSRLILLAWVGSRLGLQQDQYEWLRNAWQQVQKGMGDVSQMTRGLNLQRLIIAAGYMGGVDQVTAEALQAQWVKVQDTVVPALREFDDVDEALKSMTG